MTRLRRGLTFANVCSFLALAIAISTGGAYAADTVFSTDIVDGEVKTPDIASSAVDSSKVATNSLTAVDIRGGQSTGTISLPAGYAANGRCRDALVAISGAHVGDAVIVSANGAVPQGIMLSGVRVPSNNTAVLKVCNLSGATMPAVTNLPIAAVTITP
jgi:hypothetical protein